MAFAAAMLGLVAVPGRTRAAADPCEADDAKPARIVSISETLELTLDDGRAVVLAGLDPPRATPAHPNLGADARGALSAWTAGHGILLKPLAATPDRWNRTIATAFRPASPDAPGQRPRSLNEALLAAGWARAKPHPAIHPCFETFLGVEALARTTRLGLWSDPAYAVVGPDDRGGLAERAGTMAIVEGRLRLRSTRSRTYAYLGPFPSAFVATLSRRTAKLFAKAGMELEAYVGTEVRIRGFLDDRFGPRIDLGDPDQIESLEPGSEPLSGSSPVGGKPPGADPSGSKQWTTRTQDR